MSQLQPRLPRLLSVEQIERMHRAAVRVLDEAGFATPESVLPELLRTKGLRLSRGRVCFEPWFTQQRSDAFRAEALRTARPPAPGPIRLSVGGYAEYLVDPATDTVRPVTTADAVRSAKLIDALYDEGVRGTVMGLPSDVPIALRGLAHFRLTAEHNEHNAPRVTMTDAATVEMLYEMHAVMGLGFASGLYAVSPLSLGGTEFDVALALARSGKPCSFAVSSMPLAGATSPIHFAGSLVQGIAEGLGGAIILKLLAPHCPVCFGVSANAFDLRAGSVVYGSPEDNVLTLALMDVTEYYRGVRGARHFCRTMAKRPGMQAASEMAASAMLGAAAGTSAFGGVGMLSLDEVYSEEQLALTIEVRDYVEHVARGMEFSESALAVEEILEAVGRGEGFLAREATVARHREVYRDPRFFVRGLYAQAPEENDAALRARLRAFTEAKVRGHGYRLDAARRRELERIWRAAERRVS
jgi:trimethylamine:corrinoid methyltransferase-like protein